MVVAIPDIRREALALGSSGAIAPTLGLNSIKQQPSSEYDADMDPSKCHIDAVGRRGGSRNVRGYDCQKSFATGEE
jgi:hypothetical protein